MRVRCATARFDMGQERPPIIYYAFDPLRLNGKELQNLAIEERKSKLEELLKKPLGVIRYSVSFAKDIQELLGFLKGRVSQPHSQHPPVEERACLNDDGSDVDLPF
jgi:ATP-dependent DNA ligase